MILTIFLISVVLMKDLITVNPKFAKAMNENQQRCQFLYIQGNFEEFENTVLEIRECTNKLRHPNLDIEILDYFLPAFPNGTFEDIGNIEHFRLHANNSALPLLSPMLPDYHVFENLRFKTALIDIWYVSNLNGWRWEMLSFTNNIQIESFEFNMVSSNLIYLAPSFGKIANGRLTCVRILKCGLKWLGKNVFAPFSHLINLELRDNLIEEIKRSHLPDKATTLISLDLGNNRIKSLPEDFFEDLHLQTLYLEGNRIKILDEHMDMILNKKGSAMIQGAIWPCKCLDILNLIKKFLLNSETLKHEKCYTNNKINNIIDFMKRCN